MVSDSTYTPSDQRDSLAGVGEPVTFDVLATNNGNVDLDNTAVSNDLFKNGSGGCLQLQSSCGTISCVLIRTLLKAETFATSGVVWYGCCRADA